MTASTHAGACRKHDAQQSGSRSTSSWLQTVVVYPRALCCCCVCTRLAYAWSTNEQRSPVRGDDVKQLVVAGTYIQLLPLVRVPWQRGSRHSKMRLFRLASGRQLHM